ncbi:MAG: ATP-dependent helicase HrpB, partial [Deltaproteobacteria bacterium]|nr:ATP-dependent helicase HrpB [Deltaproteobacteria bacterium]
DLRPLHGDLPLEDQAAAVRPGGRPRVILATNVAETSVTVEGVRTVVDTGLARVATWSPWSGFPGLEVRRASRAALAQRAGRAGRTAPGRCVRLFSEADLRSRDAFEAPGILRADLAAATLLLAGAETSWEDLRWLDEPGAPAREAALALLKDLGALDRGGALTGEGRAMLELPLHPRAARVLLEGCRRGVGADACLAAALLEGREVRAGHRGTDLRPAQEAGDADLLDALERLRDLTPASAEGLLRRRDLDPGAARPVLQAASRLREASRHLWTGAPPADPDAALRRAILAGYPDRVVRRRRAGGDAVVTGEGTELQVSPASLVRHPELMVAVDAGERRDPRGRGLRRVVWSASAVEPEWLLDLDPAWTREALRVEWNASAERVEVFSRLEYRGLPLSEDRVPRARWPDVSALLLAQARKAGLERVADATAVARLRARVAFVAGAMPGEGWSPLADEDLDAALGELCRDAAGFAELRQADLAAALRRRLPRELAGALDRLAPEHVGLPGRRRAVVEYPEGSRPFVASFLQDFFRLKEAPALAGGRVRLLVHLLAPNRRAVQITDDLEGFWARHYPALRRQLMRRYPKHRWPEDPLR